jgi:hypothetical protein
MLKRTNLVKALLGVFLAAMLAGCAGPLDEVKDATGAARSAASPQIVGIDIWSVADFNAIGVDPDYPADEDYDLWVDIELVDRIPVEFNGTFNGHGKTITLTSFDPSVLADPNLVNLGIFTAVNGPTPSGGNALVEDLTIEVNMGSLTTGAATPITAIGMLAGSAATAEFNSITVAVNMSSLDTDATTTITAIGMLVGSAAGSIFDSIAVLPIYSTPGHLVITSTNTGSFVNIEVGGIIGSMAKSSISNSTSNLSIEATTAMGLVNSFSRFGGIVGAAYAGFPDPVTGNIITISNCVNTGFIKLTTNANNPCVGGIAGYTNSGAMLQLCLNTGNVTLIGTGALVTPYSGGIVGRHTNGSSIIQSYATGTVLTDAASSSSQITAGGIAGTMRNEQNNQTDISYIKDCYFRGDVTAQSAANSRNPAMAGGIVGFVYTGGSGDTQSGIVTNCYATGTVTGDSPLGAAAAGGIAGNLQEAHAAVRTSVALNDEVSITYTMSGQWTGVHRVIGFVTYGDLVDANNRAWAGMTVYDNTDEVIDPTDPGRDHLDGEAIADNPPQQEVYEDLEWDFQANTGIWAMGLDDYPVLRYRP